jgi:hypothetical protein
MSPHRRAPESEEGDQQLARADLGIARADLARAENALTGVCPACVGATIMAGLDAELATARQGVERARTRLAELAAQPSRPVAARSLSPH